MFVHLLSSPNMDIVEQVIWGLGNISGDGPTARDKVIDSGAINLINIHL